MTQTLHTRRVPIHTAAILVRNAVPAVGVYAFEWSQYLVVMDYWFDGVTWLAAMLFLALPAVRQELNEEAGREEHGWVGAVLLTLFVLLITGIPLWFMLAVVWSVLETGSMSWGEVLDGGTSIWWGAAAIALSNIVAGLTLGFPSLPEADRQKVFNWEYSLILARVAAMLLTAFLLPAKLVIILVVALTLIDLYPLKALKFFGAGMTEEDRPAVGRDS